MNIEMPSTKYSSRDPIPFSHRSVLKTFRRFSFLVLRNDEKAVNVLTIHLLTNLLLFFYLETLQYTKWPSLGTVQCTHNIGNEETLFSILHKILSVSFDYLEA
jgi:hypothetical protein